MSLPTTSSLTFLYGTHVSRCNHHVDKHFTGYQTLQYMASGAVDLTVGPHHYALRGRYFWSCFPGPRIQFHAHPWQATWHHRYIAFHGPLVARWIAEGLFPIPPQPPPGGDDYSPRFDELLALAARTDRWSPRRAAHLLEGILIDLAEHRTQHAVDASWLDQVLARLDAAATTSALPDYPALAGDLNMSLTTLRRRFRKATGQSPHTYLLHGRVNHARKLLAETALPIKTIAEQVGYRDVFFFTRQFRQFTGVPPALYRRSTQG